LILLEKEKMGAGIQIKVETDSNKDIFMPLSQLQANLEGNIATFYHH